MFYRGSEEKPLKRTHGCGTLGPGQIGQEVVLEGWVQRNRDHGGLIFIDLRDRSGIVQTVFNPETNPDAHDRADGLRSEYVVRFTGAVARRPDGTENPDLATGEVEVQVRSVEVLNAAKTPPFPITEEAEVDELVRLRHRYLDLRRPPMQRNLYVRHRAAKAIRDFLDGEGFWEIETPILLRSTPEGARDYLVPSRITAGEFYALPQSPQLMKQMLMVSGVERYFQLARCFRDEDLRADRQPEHTQIDMEMSFVERDDIFDVAERMMASMFRTVLGVEISIPFPCLSYTEAMARFGNDKPDLRFGMELVDFGDLAAGSGFRVFAQALSGGGQVKGLVAPGCAGYSRKQIDDLTTYAGAFGAKGLAYIALSPEGVRSPIAKFFTEERLRAIIDRAGAKEGDLILFVADRPEVVAESLARLRLHLGKTLGLIDLSAFRFEWIVDFPLFEYKPEDGRYTFMHNPVSAPFAEDEPLLDEGFESGVPLGHSDHPWSRARALQYDLVLNGTEIASGSIRIHRPELQEKIFRILGITPEQARDRFGWFLRAFDYGAPPHGGIAPGFDRIVAIMVGSESIRDVIAFPKTASAACPLTEAPSPVDPRQLEELHIRVIEPEKTGD
ncbi:MAG: aspartate--tRNA ligase [Armatimonadetes bacterium]|nr:aspartate--tRNA ligase [Armatimonadota bacterium]